jgi:hypothetical protein
VGASFTAQDVIGFLDRCIIDNPCWFFMDLEHGYFYTANSRLTLYADDSRWAIVFEKNGYANRATTIMLELNFYGNCLQNLERAGADGRYSHNAKFLDLVAGDALDAISSDFEQVSLAATSVKLRDRLVEIPSSKARYVTWVPDILEDDAGGRARPTFADLARFLAFEYADLCRATDTEKRACLPADVPEIMTVDQWHHRHYYYFAGSEAEVMGDPPSIYETFPLLAEVLVTRDPSRFRPTLPPTNHWSNWPEAGSL